MKSTNYIWYETTR